MSNDEQVFLKSDSFAVAGASNNREKYGNMVFRALLEHVTDPETVFPLNPNEAEVEGHSAYSSIAALPVVPAALSIITPPAVTQQIVDDAIQAGVKQIWMQPGAEDTAAIDRAEQAGITVIANGPCILVALKLNR